MPDLEALIARLAGIDALPQGSKQATREMAVNPVLDALGWDTFDPGEVAREYAVLDGGVDYCLRLRNRSRILIEVKRTGADLPEHQRRLLRYALQEGVDLGALTDGLVWWLYLPGGADGSEWERRRFFSLDLAREPAAKAAAALRGFLGREETASGAALEAARREFERLERARRVRGTLPDAWKRILSEPDELLVLLLQDEVAAISGDRPDEAAVIEFLRGTLRQEPLPAVPPPTAPGPSVPPTQPVDYTGKRPAAFRLDGVRHEVASWRAVLAGTCELLVQEAGLRRFAQAVAPIGDGKRVLFSADRSQLRMPIAIAGGDFFADGNFDANDAERRARAALTAVRGPHGADSFSIELAAAPGPSATPRTAPDYRGKRPAAFLLDGVRHEVAYWRAVLTGTCELLVQEAGLRRFAQAVAPIRGETRVYFSADRSQIYKPIAIAGGDFFAYGDLTANDAVRLAREALIAVRGPHGADSFSIELAAAPGPPPPPPTAPDYRGRRPAAFLLDGVRHEVAYWRTVLAETCELLVREAGLRRFAQAVAPIGGETRVYFSADRSQLHKPIAIAGGDFFAYGNLTANDAVRLAREALIAVRGPRGADSFTIELAE